MFKFKPQNSEDGHVVLIALSKVTSIDLFKKYAYVNLVDGEGYWLSLEDANHLVQLQDRVFTSNELLDAIQISPEEV